MFCIAWEAESDPLPLDFPPVYCEPVTTEPTNSRNAITQQLNDEHSSQRYRDASDFLNDEPHSQKHSSQNYVNTPKTDFHNNIDAVNENDGTLEPCHDLSSDMTQSQLHLQK